MAHRTILLAISGQSSSRTESYFKIWSTSKDVFCSAWSEHCIYYYYLNHIQLDIAWIVRAHQNLMIHAKPYRIAVTLFSNILHSTFSELAIDRMFPIRGFKYPKTRFYLVYLPCSSIYQSSTCFLIMDHNWFYNLSFIILLIGAMKTAVLFCIKLLKTFPWKCVIIYSHGILFINFIFNKQTKCLFISANSMLTHSIVIFFGHYSPSSDFGTDTLLMARLFQLSKWIYDLSPFFCFTSTFSIW